MSIDDRATPADSTPTRPLTEAESTAGRATIGRYQIQRVLGRGGMGVVVAAHDPELDRTVAVKILVEHGGRADLLGTALRREAQALARVTHPNVLAVYDAGVDGSPYLVMQLVDGETLGAHLERVRPATDAVLGLFLQAARGLSAVHAAGLIHRDVKPSNILVDKRGVVHVADLGLARISELALGSDPKASPSAHTSTIAGTPAYMAPEQLAGRELTPACDQFSFCVALWEAWFGQRPATSPAEVRAPGVSREQIQTLRRGLSPDPAARFPSMDALAAALARRSRAPWLIVGGLAATGAVAIAGAFAIAAWAGSSSSSVSSRAVGAPPAAGTGKPAPFELTDVRRLTLTDACDEYPSVAADGTIYYDAVVGADQHLYAIDPKTRQSRELTQTKGWDLAPQPSPDGKRLVWLRKTADTMAAHVAPIDNLASARQIIPGGFRPTWSPDGRFVWAGGRKGISRYDVETLAVDRSLTLPEGAFPMHAIELADGRVVVLTKTGSATADGLVIYEGTTQAPRVLIPTNDNNPMEEVLSLSPRGEGVLVAKLEVTNNTEIWHIPLDGSPGTAVAGATVQAHKRLNVHGKSLVWSDCTEFLSIAAVTKTATGATKFIDLARNKWVDFSPAAVPGTEDIVFLSYRSTTDEVWRMAKTGENPRVIPFGKQELDRITVSHDGKWLTGSNDNGLFVGPIDGSAEPIKLIDKDEQEQNAVFSRDGMTVFAELRDGKLDRIASFPRTGGKPTWVLPAPSLAPATSPTEDILAYLAEVPGKALQRAIMLHDLGTKKTRRLAVPPYPYRDLRWSPDGKRLLAIRRDGQLSEVEVATSKILRTFDTGADQLYGATYSGDDIFVGHSTSAGDIWSAELR